MNAEDIRNMEAGRELDALVAEKVMGWQWYDGHGTAGPSYWETQGGEFAHFGEFEPSTDIAAAWEVVEKMAELVGPISVAWGSFGTEGNMASVMAFMGNPPGVVAPTAPLAICRAALLAVMERDE